MKTTRKCVPAAAALLCMVCLAVPAFADSSWVWISETRPYDVLAWVAMATLVIETGIIWYVGKTGKLWKVFGVVVLGNLLSFAAPYVLAACDPIYPFMQALKSLPIYTVGWVYLLMTLLVELPIEYSLLKKDAGERTRPLLYAVIASNVLTTVMVAVVERIFCYGRW